MSNTSPQRRARRAATAALILVLAACQSGRDAPPPTGAVLPTVSGRAASAFSSAAEARQAFTRSAGTVTAALEDAAWLRFEGPPEEVARAHRAYFDYGYTTFLVELRCSDFVQPTNETFWLEDSQGVRLSGKPVTYEGSHVLVDDRYFTRFSLSFQHVLSRDLEWIRLTRAADGSQLEWRFEASPAPCASPPPAPVRR